MSQAALSPSSALQPQPSTTIAPARTATALQPSQRRTLERLRERLRDEEREGFVTFSGSHLARIDYARTVREEIAALDVALAALASPVPPVPYPERLAAMQRVIRGDGRVTNSDAWDVAADVLQSIGQGEGQR
jgi:hypothetical protein